MCVALVTSSTGACREPELIDRRDGFVRVRYVPTEPGPHQLAVTYNDLPVSGSPWQFVAEKVDVESVRAYGAGLSHGVATAPCQFSVHSHGNDDITGVHVLQACFCRSLNVQRKLVRGDSENRDGNSCLVLGIFCKNVHCPSAHTLYV